MGQADDVVKQGLNLNVQVSIDASITRPELRRVGEQQRRWDLELEEAWRAESSSASGPLLVIVADQIVIGRATRHADAGSASRSTQVPQVPSTWVLAACSSQLSHGEKGTACTKLLDTAG